MLPKTKLGHPRIFKEDGVDIARHQVDQFTYFRHFLDSTRREPFKDRNRYVTGISFTLPYPAGADVPHFTLFGDGDSFCNGFFHGNEEYDAQLLSNRRFVTKPSDVFDLSTMRNGIPTTEVTPFLHGGGRGFHYPGYGIRQYDVEVAPWRVVRVQSTIAKVKDLDRVDVIIDPDKDHIQALEIQRSDGGWSCRDVRYLDEELTAPTEP